MKKSDLATKTIDHGGPEASCNDPGVPALVCAFPAPCAVPVAALNGILGRKTLREAGVLDGEVSTEHARLVREGRTFRLTDLGSRNGTFVDGRRVLAGEPVSLVDGALLRVGRTV
ncbi:MAG: FHA domain-containing protein, partial [Deltaproteobacteria bacterium]|nr:FHA domain-containing protein [Deltaproteobacteria bacterium]